MDAVGEAWEGGGKSLEVEVEFFFLSFFFCERPIDAPLFFLSFLFLSLLSLSFSLFSLSLSFLACELLRGPLRRRVEATFAQERAGREELGTEGRGRREGRRRGRGRHRRRRRRQGRADHFLDAIENRVLFLLLRAPDQARV